MPGIEATKQQAIRSAALEYREAGLSIIPCNAEKIPCLTSWKPYQKKAASIEQVSKWFGNGNHNVAIIAGQISGALEILDFDSNGKAFHQWGPMVLEQDPELFQKLVFEKSPHGVHAAYRCSGITIPGNTKLAMGLDEKVLVETRGEGGYCLVAPSKGYELERGNFTKLQDISAKERNVLLECAKACNEFQPKDIQRGYTATAKTGGDLLPGQDFDERGDPRPYLIDAGWVCRGKDREGRERWARPGKVKGWSATLTENILYVFSTNGAPFEDQKAYSPFAVYTLLEHEGNFSEAAKELVKKGFGSRAAPEAQAQPPGQPMKPRGSSTPSMADLREYVDLCLTPGQKFTVDEMCRGLGCYSLKDRQNVYQYVKRLCGKNGMLKKDSYKYGGYRVIANPQSIDLSGDVTEDQRKFDVRMPLDLHNLFELKINQVCQVSGRYDAGKSTFLFQVLADNYFKYPIIHFISEEWDPSAIKERMDVLGIPRPHEKIQVFPMVPGYEDAIPEGRCLVLIDYVRANSNPFETDSQIQQIIKSLRGGVCIFATQKHPGLDRPVGGQFAVHACHHIVLLDRWKDKYTCKIYRTKKGKSLEGYYKTFTINNDMRICSAAEDWRDGNIKWEKDQL